MSNWDERRGLRRCDTASLLVPGGVIALIVTAAVYYENSGTLSKALNHEGRLTTFRLGLCLVAAALVGLTFMLSWPQDFYRSMKAAQKGDEYKRDKQGVCREFETRWSRLYYCTVAAEVFGFWMLATSTGGYIRSPLGLVFTSTILFGQIRANKRQDIIILLVAGFVGVLLSDLITYRGWLPALFPPNEDIVIKPATWYLAIPASIGLSTWINFLTFDSLPIRTIEATPSKDHQSRLLEAQYGANNVWLDISRPLRVAIARGAPIIVSNELAGSDPIENVPKSVRLRYSLEGEELSVEIPEGGTIELPPGVA